MVFATLAFLGAFGADQGLLTYFADLSGPGLPYYVSIDWIPVGFNFPLKSSRVCVNDVPSCWATKVSTIGQQALLGAEGAEESQGHKALEINRP